MNILITSAGQRVSLIRFFKMELKEVFKDAKVYAVDMNPQLSPACHVADGSLFIEHALSDNYINLLMKICKHWDIRLIIPTIDTELLVLSKNKHIFESEGIQIVISDFYFVNICRDKRLINNFFIERLIDIPQPIDKNDPTFPLFIKPYDGSLSKDIFLINQEGELTDYHFSNEKLMFMEYVNPNDYKEYTIDAYYNKQGELKCCVPRERIAVRSGEISKGKTAKNFLHTYIFEKLSKIEGARGCLTIQVFYNSKNNQVKAIEINPRFGGGYPLSYHAQANYPKWIIEEYLLNKTINIFEDWTNDLLMLRYDDEIIVKND